LSSLGHGIGDWIAVEFGVHFAFPLFAVPSDTAAFADHLAGKAQVGADQSVEARL
jgi:hypothetical protein